MTQQTPPATPPKSLKPLPPVRQDVLQKLAAIRANARRAVEEQGLAPGETRTRLQWSRGPIWSTWEHPLETRPRGWGSCVLLDTVEAITPIDQLLLAVSRYRIPARLWLDPLDKQRVIQQTTALLAKGPVYVVLAYDYQMRLEVSLHGSIGSVETELA